MKDNNLLNKFPSMKYLNGMEIQGDHNSRVVKCFCGKNIQRSIVNHLRTEHRELWAEWLEVFTYLNNKGMHPRSIIRRFMVNQKYLFSWTVVENELKKVFESNPELISEPSNLIKSLGPKDFSFERTTVWNFNKRGNWAVHDSRYRGNWPPQLVRNIIEKYSKENAVVVDVFAGGGTTLFESWLLKRKSIGIDINPVAVKIIENKIEKLSNYFYNSGVENSNYRPKIITGNSEELDDILSSCSIPQNCVDIICAHPPYLDSLKYSKKIDRDLSLISSEEQFLNSLLNIFVVCNKYLSDDGKLIVLIGDVRKSNKLITLGFDTLNTLKKAGFLINEIIIKTQNKDSSTGFYRNHQSLDYLIAHEYLFICSKGRD